MIQMHSQKQNMVMPQIQNNLTPKELKAEVAYFLMKAYVTSNEAVMMIFANKGYKILG